MTVRHKRRRAKRGGLTQYKLAELLTGEPWYPAMRYSGYGDGTADIEQFVGEEMVADWKAYRDEILKFWISGRFTGGLSFQLTERSEPFKVSPWIFLRGFAGTRPWAWWRFDAPEPLGDEDETDYLRRHDLLLPGEDELIAEHAREQIEELKEHRALVKARVWGYTDAEARKEVRAIDAEIRKLEAA